MSISLELWQFLFTKDLTKNPEIENTPVLRLSNLKRQGRLSEKKKKNKKKTLQNARFSAFTVSQLLREFQQGK